MYNMHMISKIKITQLYREAIHNPYTSILGNILLIYD